jgi:segregation and condensation protein A
MEPTESGEFELRPVELATGEAGLVVDVAGFEGPLDLLLTLARAQQVDLSKISILALAEQYLAFIERARDLRMELAADYLVMAAWLAYLKSRLLLPEPPESEQPTAADLAADLARRLQHLEAIRRAAGQLLTRDQLGQHFFARGMPEMGSETPPAPVTATLYDLLTAYAIQRQKRALAHLTMGRRVVWSLSEARAAIERIVGTAIEWTELDRFLLSYVVEPSMRATVRASGFAAALEMVREGQVEVQQQSAFAPLWLRRRAHPQTPSGGNPQ